MKVKCDYCGTEFDKISAEIKRTKSNFCSKSCAASYNNKKFPKKKAKQEYYCSVCGKKVGQINTRCIDHKVKRYKNKPKRDLKYKLANRLRTRLNAAIRNKYKSGSAVRDLGCTIEELISYLESRFQQDMTWDNWSREGWHIDHIIPLSNFDLSDKYQFKKACHYTNLQPLWAKDNLKKGSKK